MTQKKAQAKKKTTAKKTAAKKPAAKKAAAKKAPAKKPGRPAKVKIEENVIKIDDIAEITIDPEVVAEISEAISSVSNKSWFKKILAFLKK
jgi:sRNA-binding protein